MVLRDTPKETPVNDEPRLTAGKICMPPIIFKVNRQLSKVQFQELQEIIKKEQERTDATIVIAPYSVDVIK